MTDDDQSWERRTFAFQRGDDLLCEWVKEQMGFPSKAEVVRTALRAYAMHVEQITRNTRPKVD